MQNFKVTVNGRVYNVSVAENTGGELKAEPAFEKESVPVISEVTPKPTTVSAGDTPINSPLAGTILSIKVKPGESVNKNQVLLTLEALKMENEIVAPEAGLVNEVFVKTGDTVNVGDTLLSLRS
ncbi:MAG TPA: biotin/lipoyl-containing protein [Bacillota bacterium]|nr:biotin/lipoyl-containing protein [Bacillota bacterium]